MTSISPEEQNESTIDRLQATLTSWISPQVLVTAGIVVVVAASIVWFYMRSKEIAIGKAERDLMNAKQSLAAGNMALAQSDLQNVFAKYGSTPSGVEAALLLAQSDYDSGKPQDGISALQKVSGSGAGQRVESTVLSLEGDGYSQLGKMADAAKQYAAAADVSAGETQKAMLRAKAARAYQVAGDTAAARKIWSDLATDPKTQSISGEAKVRLGELTAQPAKR